MADRTLQVNGQDFVINRDKKADVTQLTVNGSAFTVDRTAPVIDSDPVGNSRPLLGKLVGDAAAAYSLRDLNTKQGDTDVVNVRRSGDNLEKVFQAKDVNSIEDWANGKQETTLPADVSTAAAAYSLRKVKASYSGNAVRIRRSSDNIEVDVAFDSDGKVSASSPITDGGTELTPSPDADLGTTTATTLGGFLTEDINIETSDFSSGVDGYEIGSFGVISREASFEGENDVLKYVLNGGRHSFKNQNVPISNAGSYTVTLKYYAPTAYNNYYLNFGSAFANKTSLSDYVQITSGSWQTATLTLTAGSPEFVSTPVDLNLRVSSANTGSDSLYGTTTQDTMYFKDIVVTATNSGAFVHTWYDQAGSNDAVQETASNQPKIAESGALLADGIDFDGSNDELETGANITGSTINGFVVANLDGTDGKSLYSVGDTKPNVLFGNPSLAYVVNGGTALSGGTAPTLKDTLFTSLFISGGTSKGFINAVEVSSGSAGSNSASSDKLTIGNLESGDRFMNGSMKELILYTSDQSNNRFKIESNINNYYGLYNDANELTQTGWQATGVEGDFVSTSTDGFSYQNSSGTSFVGVTLKETLALNDSVFVSFNATGVDIPDESPQIRLRDSVNGGSASSSLIGVVQNGFNSFELTYDQSNYSSGDNIVFSEGNTGGGTVTISDFKVSRIARNGFVETWYDQSGNNKNAVQIQDNKQPQLIANGGLYPSGIKFNGSTTSLATGSQVLTANETGSQSIYTVCNVTDGASGYIAGSADNDSGGNKIGQSIYYYTSTDVFALSNGSSATNTTVDRISAIRGSNVLVSFNYNNNNDNTLNQNANQNGYSNGTDAYDFEAGSNFIIGARGGTVQAGRALNGFIQEVIAYNSDQSLNRPAIEANINNQYQIY